MRPPADPPRPHGIVDPDVDLHDPAQRAETRPHELDLLAVIAAGGVLGAEARYGIDRLIPPPTAGFPWATLLINVTGCLLIGVLMVLLIEVWSPHRYARPFLGVGVLGGYTTFSTFAVDSVRLVRAQHVGSAAAYVVASVVCCLVAVVGATLATRRLTTVRVVEAAR
jgi:CrcB protein